MSLDGDNLNKLAGGLIVAKIGVYYGKFSVQGLDDLNSLAPSSFSFLALPYIPAFSNFLELFTSGDDDVVKVTYKVAGKYPFTTFFKAPSDNVDMFKDIIAPILK